MPQIEPDWIDPHWPEDRLTFPAVSGMSSGGMRDPEELAAGAQEIRTFLDSLGFEDLRRMSGFGGEEEGGR